MPPELETRSRNPKAQKADVNMDGWTKSHKPRDQAVSTLGFKRAAWFADKIAAAQPTTVDSTLNPHNPHLHKRNPTSPQPFQPVREGERICINEVLHMILLCLRRHDAMRPHATSCLPVLSWSVYVDMWSENLRAETLEDLSTTPCTLHQSVERCVKQCAS